MRYLLHESQMNELSARLEYLYDVFCAYFFQGKAEGEYIPLLPLGSYNLDILFITGHNNYVQDYLEKMIDCIPETCICITSCMGASFYRFAAKKELYVPDPHKDVCLLRDGKPYGFGFSISDAELNLYNATGDIMDRVQKAYSRLQKRR